MWVIYFQIFGAPLDVYCCNFFFFGLILLWCENILGKISFLRFVLLPSMWSFLVNVPAVFYYDCDFFKIINFTSFSFKYFKFRLLIVFIFIIYCIFPIYWPLCHMEYAFLSMVAFFVLKYVSSDSVLLFCLVMLISFQFFNLNFCCWNVFHLIMNNHFSLIMLNFFLILSLKFVFLHLL